MTTLQVSARSRGAYVRTESERDSLRVKPGERPKGEMITTTSLTGTSQGSVRTSCTKETPHTVPNPLRLSRPVRVV